MDSVVSVAIKRVGADSATAAELMLVAEVLADAATFLPLDEKFQQAREDVGCALAERAAAENVLLLREAVVATRADSGWVYDTILNAVRCAKKLRGVRLDKDTCTWLRSEAEAILMNSMQQVANEKTTAQGELLSSLLGELGGTEGDTVTAARACFDKALRARASHHDFVVAHAGGGSQLDPAAASGGDTTALRDLHAATVSLAQDIAALGSTIATDEACRAACGNIYATARKDVDLVVDNLLSCLLEKVFSAHVLLEKIKYGVLDGDNWMASFSDGSLVSFKDLLEHANKTLMISSVLPDLNTS